MGEKEEELLGCATFAQLKLPPDSKLVAVKKAGVTFLEDAGEEMTTTNQAEVPPAGAAET